MPATEPRHQAFIVREGAAPGVRYESGLTVYDEALVDGYWIGRYWSAIGRVRPESEAVPELGPTREIDAPGPLARAAFQLALSGEDLTGGWIWVGAGEINDRLSPATTRPATTPSQSARARAAGRRPGAMAR
jgi:hypothetical protein